MDGDQVAAQDNSPAWWESTIDYVVRAAAAKRFASPQLQNGQSYYVDANGNVVPTGQVIPAVQGQINAAMATNPLLMLAGLALAGVILYKLVK